MSNASNIFTGLSYNQGKRVTVGAISIPIPDGSRCAMSQPSGEVKSKLSADLRDYLDFACVPESDPRGTDGYQDTDYSITLQKPQTISNLPYAWQSNSVDDVASQLISMIDKNTNPTPYTQSPTVTRKEKGLITGYLRYCGDDTEGEFWRSYTIFILCDEFFESGMFYFNQKAPESVFTTTIRNWLAEVRPAPEKSIDDLRAKIGQERLGPYAGQNGKVNALLTARLFAEDVLFFPEQKLDRSGNSVKLNLQVNMQKIIEHPWFIQNGQVFIDAFLELAKDLDGEESLKIPKSRLHPQMLRPLLDDRLTGLSFLNLMAYHMVKIVEADSSGNQYTVMVDRNLAAGIPDVRQYIGKFIKFCRSYNGITGKFSVDFISAMNFDSPISGSLTPVSGADTSFGSLTVDADGSMSHAGNSVLERILAETIRETASASVDTKVKDPEEEGKSVSNLEAALDEDVVEGLKKYAAEAFAAYNRIPDILNTISFSKLKSSEKVLDSIMDAINMSPDDFVVSINYLHSSITIEYWKNSVYYNGYGLERIQFNLYCKFENGYYGASFDPMQTPNELIAAVKALSENEIYRSVLEKAVEAKKNGADLIAPNSAKDVVLKLEREGEIEVSGTQYEGRSERIENVKVGDSLTLVREPDNPIDENAIDVRNSSGSLGHIPANIAEYISPQIDSGKIRCSATVSDVVPLSKRGSRARKAILKVKINVSPADKTAEKSHMSNPSANISSKSATSSSTKADTKQKSASANASAKATGKSASTNTSNKTNTTKQDQKTKEQKLEEEYNKALEDRKAEIARRTEEEKERLQKILDSEIEQAEKRHEAEINKLDEEKEQKKQKLAELQQELDGLGFLKFKRKSELKDLIAEANRDLNATVRKIDDAEKGHKKSLERSQRAYEINFEDFTRKVEELVPAPKEPEHLVKRREEERKKKELREKEIEEDRLRMIIVDYIRDNGQVTLGEVIKHVNYHRTLDKKDPLSSAEIIKLMKEPKENGYFTHAQINGITYFIT
ncbi:MAG: hypothetical protein II635_03360 [Oscillospiraceae bacterium]|nr:hypothetical protein [Oscillospiraceae bacterium]